MNRKPKESWGVKPHGAFKNTLLIGAQFILLLCEALQEPVDITVEHLENPSLRFEVQTKRRFKNSPEVLKRCGLPFEVDFPAGVFHQGLFHLLGRDASRVEVECAGQHMLLELQGDTRTVTCKPSPNKGTFSVTVHLKKRGLKSLRDLNGFLNLALLHKNVQVSGRPAKDVTVLSVKCQSGQYDRGQTHRVMHLFGMGVPFGVKVGKLWVRHRLSALHFQHFAKKSTLGVYLKDPGLGLHLEYPNENVTHLLLKQEQHPCESHHHDHLWLLSQLLKWVASEEERLGVLPHRFQHPHGEKVSRQLFKDRGLIKMQIPQARGGPVKFICRQGEIQPELEMRLWSGIPEWIADTDAIHTLNALKGHLPEAKFAHHHPYGLKVHVVEHPQGTSGPVGWVESIRLSDQPLVHLVVKDPLLQGRPYLLTSRSPKQLKSDLQQDTPEMQMLRLLVLAEHHTRSGRKKAVWCKDPVNEVLEVLGLIKPELGQRKHKSSPKKSRIIKHVLRDAGPRGGERCTSTKPSGG